MFNIDEITIDKEEAGVWTQFRGSDFLIASSGATKFQRLFSRLQMPHRKAIEKKKLDPVTQLDIMAKSMSQTLILDWKNVVDKDKNEVPFTVERAYQALKKNAEFRDFVTEYSTEIENYVSEEKEELGKSVEESSTGSSSMESEKSSSKA